MSDAAFSCITGGLWLALFTFYRLRVRRYGAYRSARVDSVGGTKIVGVGMMHATYWAIDPAVRGLVALGISANAATTIALVLGLAAGVATACGAFGVACLLATLSVVCDALDGQIARLTKTTSAAGALYDSVVDRYSEFAFLGGFMVYAHDSAWQVALAAMAMHSSYMISYASASAEARGVTVPRGLMRRHERAAVLLLTCGLTPLLGPAIHARWSTVPETVVFAVGIALVAVIGGIAAIQRYFWISEALRRLPPSTETAGPTLPRGTRPLSTERVRGIG